MKNDQYIIIRYPNIVMSQFLTFFGLGFLLFIFPTTIVSGQNKTLNDLLSKNVEFTNQDIFKVDLLNEIGWEYYRVDNEKLFEYSNQALGLANKLDYLKGRGRALNLIAIYHSILNNDIKAKELNEEVLEIGSQLNDTFLIGMASNDLAIYYSLINEFDQAIELYLKSLKFAGTNNLSRSITLANLEQLHRGLGNAKEAQFYLHELIGLKTNDNPRIEINIKTAVGVSQLDNGEIENAIEQLSNALEIARENKLIRNQIELGLDLAYAYRMSGKQEKSLNLIEDALQLARSSHSLDIIQWCYVALSEYYSENEEYEKALKYLNLEIEESHKKNFIGFDPTVYWSLAMTQSKMGHHETAFQYLLDYVDIKDSIAQEEKNKIVLSLSTEFKTEQQAKENKFLLEQQAKKEALLKGRSIIAFSSLLILLLSLSLLYLLYRTNRRQKKLNTELEDMVLERTKELNDKNDTLIRTVEELEQFIYISSHDLKSPIITIREFARQLKIKYGYQLDKQGVKFVDIINSVSAQMQNTLESLLGYTELGRKKDQIEKLDLNDMVQFAILNLSSEIQISKAKIEFANLPIISGSKSGFIQLFQNLISNSIKFIKPGKDPLIQIESSEQEESYTISVKDNGIGMNEQYHSKAFEIFRQLNPIGTYQGAGIGLANCKKIIEKIGGHIKFTSKIGNGTTFFIEIPKTT